MVMDGGPCLTKGPPRMVGIDPSMVFNAATQLDYADTVVEDVRHSVHIALTAAEMSSQIQGVLASLDLEFTSLANTLRPRANEAQFFRLEFGIEFDETYRTLRAHLDDPDRSRPDDKNNSILLLANELALRAQDQEGQLSDEVLERMLWDHPDARVRETAAMLLRYPSETVLGPDHGPTSDRTLWHSLAQSHLEELTNGSSPFAPINQSDDINDVIGGITLDQNHAPPVSLQYLWDNGHLDDAQLYQLAPPTAQQGDFAISTADFAPQPYWSEDDVQNYVDRWVEENPDGLLDPQAAGETKLDEWLDIIASQVEPQSDVTWDDVLGFAVAAAQYGTDFVVGCLDLAGPVATTTAQYGNPQLTAVATAAGCAVGGFQYAGTPWTEGTGVEIFPG